MGRPGRPRNHDPTADRIVFAIQRPSPTEARQLIDQAGTEVLDGDSRTPIIWASFEGDLDLVNWLIEHGANIDHQDRNGYCALHAAAQWGHVDILQRLLAAGAKTELKDHYGNTPLWTASFNARGNYSLVRLLIEFDANPRSLNEVDKSPLDIATTIGDEELERELNGIAK